MSTLQTIHDVPVLMCASEGEAIGDERDVLDLIGDAGYQGAQWVVIPVGRLNEAFFDLRTRVAGEIIQKFINYRLGIVVLGDISHHTAASSACRTSSGNATAGGRHGSSSTSRNWGRG